MWDAGVLTARLNARHPWSDSEMVITDQNLPSSTTPHTSPFLENHVLEIVGSSQRALT